MRIKVAMVRSASTGASRFSSSAGVDHAAILSWSTPFSTLYHRCGTNYEHIAPDTVSSVMQVRVSASSAERTRSLKRSQRPSTLTEGFDTISSIIASKKGVR